MVADPIQAAVYFPMIKGGFGIHPNSSRSLLLILPLACCAFLPLSQCLGQVTGPVPAVASFTVTARTVVVDVVVTGKRSKPITGLHKEDFEVREDGQTQRITSFEEHTGTPAPGAQTPQSPKESLPNLFTNVPPATSSDSMIILLIDSLNTPLADQSRVTNAVLQYLHKLPPGRRIAIFTLGSQLRCVQGITGEASVLNAIANDLRNGLAMGGSPLLATKTQQDMDKESVAEFAEHSNAQSGSQVADFQKGEATMLDSTRGLSTLDAFRQLAHYLSGIPGRKSVAWFSGAFPHLVFSNSTAQETFNAQRYFSEEARATEAALIAAQVAIYPIAAEGLATISSYESDTQLRGDASLSKSAAPRQQEISESLSADGKVRNDNQASMEEIAQATGGEAFFNGNNLDGALARVADTGSHYYTLFYAPSNSAPEDEYRKIAVTLTSSHYKLAYNRGYYVREGGSASAFAAKAGTNPLDAYMRPEALDSTQLPIDLRVNPKQTQSTGAALPGARRSGSACSSNTANAAHPFTCYTVQFDVNAGLLRFNSSQDGLHEGSLELMLLVSDKSGKTLNGLTSKVNLKLDAAHYAEMLANGAHLELQVGVPNDAVSLRGGVYDWTSGLAGTLKVPLDHIVASSEPRLLPKTALSSETLLTKATTEARTTQEPAAPQAQPVGLISARDNAVAIAPPQPAAETESPASPVAPGRKGGSATFWTLSPKEVNKMLASSADENGERYARLREYFTKYGCTGHMSEAHPQLPGGQNLVCMLPGTDTRTIVVTARYGRREHEDVEAQNWASAIMLVRLYKALQAQQRQYSFVFVALANDGGEKQFLDSLASADLTSLAAVVALDLHGPGQVHFKLSQPELHAPTVGLVSDAEVLRARAIRNGEVTKRTLTATLMRSAQLTRMGQPDSLDPPRAVENAQLFRRSTYIPSILLYTVPRSPDAVAVRAPSEGASSLGMFDLLGTYLCGLDSNLVGH